MILAFLLLLAATALSFTIPAGQKDGVYSVSIDASGSEVHTLLSLTGNSNMDFMPRDINSSTEHALEPRQHGGYKTFCGGYPLNHVQTDAANQALDKQCGAGANVEKDKNFYSTSGCTVAYFCNFDDDHGDTCFADEREAITKSIFEQCGKYAAGWAIVDFKTRKNQYGVENLCGRGGNFCRRGLDGR